MFVRDAGSGSVVVLLHATASPLSDWFPLADVLSRGHRVLLPELPPGTTVEHARAALAAMLAERGGPCPHALIGLASGAYRALDLALHGAITPAVVIALAGIANPRPADSQRGGVTTPRAAELASLAGARDLRPDLPRLGARVYARVGALDRSCPPGWSDELTRLVPRGTLELVLGCGHRLLHDDGRQTVAAIVRELATPAP